MLALRLLSSHFCYAMLRSEHMLSLFMLGLLILEYCTTIWSPYNIDDINTLENIQRTFTCKIYQECHLPHAPYDNKLQF